MLPINPFHSLLFPHHLLILLQIQGKEGRRRSKKKTPSNLTHSFIVITFYFSIWAIFMLLHFPSVRLFFYCCCSSHYKWESVERWFNKLEEKEETCLVEEKILKFLSLFIHFYHVMFSFFTFSSRLSIVRGWQEMFLSIGYSKRQMVMMIMLLFIMVIIMMRMKRENDLAGKGRRAREKFTTLGWKWWWWWCSGASEWLAKKEMSFASFFSFFSLPFFWLW